MIRGSGCCELYLRHVEHSLTSCSSSLRMPGHQTVWLALSRHFEIPRCPECSFLSMSERSACGMTCRLPLRRSPRCTENSCLTAEYALYGPVRDAASGHPSRQYSVTCRQMGSLLCCERISYRRSSVAGKQWTTRSTNACTSDWSSSPAVILDTGALDRVSADVRSFPATCEME